MDIDFFPIILNERMSYKRKFRREPLFNYLWILSDFIAKTGSENLLVQIEEQLSFFLSEAEIYYGLTDEKANDALQELALLSTLFYGTNHYEKIGEYINKIRVSYPVPEYGQSNVPTYFLPKDI